MHKSKLIDILRTFDAKALREFDDFLASPYFNRNTQLRDLFAALRPHAPAYPEEQVDRYVIWAALFPGRAADDKEIAYLMSGLLGLAERFVGQKYYEALPLQQDIHVLAACEERNLEKHFRRTLKRIRKWQEKDPRRSQDFFHAGFQVATIMTQYQQRRQARMYDSHLQETVNFLDDFYLIAKLRHTCELINRQKILSATYDIRLVDELLGYLDYYDYEKVPAMAVYYRLLRMLTDDADDRHFRKFRDLIDRYFQVFPDEQKEELFSFAQNYCIRRIRQGEAPYLRELFELNQSALQAGFLLREGTLSPWKYKNIASVGLRVRAFEWVEDFIGAYRDRLPAEFRDTAYAYNMAYLHYARGEHDQALRYLMQVEYSDVFFSLDTRKMMLMIYFEQGEVEAMLSLIASFRIYLRRNKLISDNNREAYTNFVHLVNAIYKSSVSGGRDPGVLRETIERTTPIVEEDWLKQAAAKGFEPAPA